MVTMARLTPSVDTAPPPRGQTFQVVPEVIIDNVLSARHTVLEVAGLDRPGLLYDLTTAIGKLNLNIASAHIATFGEKAVDVFYVTDLTNAKIVSTARQLTIRKALLDVFGPDGEKGPSAKGKVPAIVGMPDIPITVGGRFTIAGIGVTVRGDGKSGGTIRAAGLVATGRPGTLQIRLVDPVGGGTRDGLGACTGDSGGPVLEDKAGGPVIIGVISWSTGPNGAAGCGGMTGVTPLTLYRDWVLQTARQWGAAL